jgi:hypothetical protein
MDTARGKTWGGVPCNEIAYHSQLGGELWLRGVAGHSQVLGCAQQAPSAWRSRRSLALAAGTRWRRPGAMRSMRAGLGTLRRVLRGLLLQQHRWPALPTQFIQGFAGRVTGGVAYNINGGPKLSLDGELGGLGNDFLTWSVRGRASLPF